MLTVIRDTVVAAAVGAAAAFLAARPIADALIAVVW